MRADLTSYTWLDAVPKNEHFCEPRLLSEVTGIAVRRSMQAELASGTRETVSSAAVRIERKIVEKFYAVAEATMQEIRGTRTLRLKPWRERARSNFRKDKMKKSYKRLSEKVFAALDSLDGRIRIKRAHFDCETGAYTAFQRYFPEVDVELCAFHVKQGLNRQIQAKGLTVVYQEYENVQRVVRMLGPAIGQSGEISGLVLGTSSRSTSLWPKDYESRGKLSWKTKGALQNESAAGRVDSMLQRCKSNQALRSLFCAIVPRPQSELCQQLTEKLVTAEVYFDNVLEHKVEDENFPEKLWSYLQRVGHLMGFNGSIDAIKGLPAEEEVESEQEEIIEEGDPAEINLFDV
uniref:Transposase n=1 Tax=Ditylenchus dipsaci TaxID=166011 RepID=A0A915DPP4_9BILA